MAAAADAAQGGTSKELLVRLGQEMSRRTATLELKLARYEAIHAQLREMLKTAEVGGSGAAAASSANGHSAHAGQNGYQRHPPGLPSTPELPSERPAQAPAEVDGLEASPESQLYSSNGEDSGQAQDQDPLPSQSSGSRTTAVGVSDSLLRSSESSPPGTGAQSSYADAQVGYADAQIGYDRDPLPSQSSGSRTTAAGISDSLFRSSESPPPGLGAQIGYAGAQVGYAGAQIGYADAQISYADARLGYTDARISYADGRIGYADPQISYADALWQRAPPEEVVPFTRLNDFPRRQPQLDSAAPSRWPAQPSSCGPATDPVDASRWPAQSSACGPATDPVDASRWPESLPQRSRADAHRRYAQRMQWQ